MVNFAATTRRWHDRGDPRDAGECCACQITVSFQPFPLKKERLFLCPNDNFSADTYILNTQVIVVW